MEKLDLKAKTRTVLKKQVEQLREKNILPANIYGPNLETQSLEVDLIPFKKVFEEAGQSTLVDLTIDGKEEVKVLIQDVQLNPETDQPMHVDFRQINMKEKVIADVVLKFVGESQAVKELGGVLVRNLDQVKIECLPIHLINELEVDISSLKDFDTVIHVKDLDVPENITILDKLDQTVALVEAPRTEEELSALDDDIVVETPEGAEEDKEESGEDEDKDKEAKSEGTEEKKEEKKKE